MRKIIVAATLMALALGMVSAQAGHGARTVEGSILVPTVYDPEVGLLTRPARCAYLLAPDANGVFGYAVEFTEEEGDGAHSFELTSSGDPHVVFFESMGTCDNAPAPSTLGEFVNEGTESGDIPGGAVAAIVVVEGTPNASFEFAIS
jgi:hypothetical protein